MVHWFRAGQVAFWQQIAFPVNIQASHRDHIYQAQLITLKGIVLWNGQNFETPSSAAKTVVTDWTQYDPDWTEKNIEETRQALTGDIDISENERNAAFNHRHKYWLYVAYGCGSSMPNLIRINDPWAKLLAQAKSFVIKMSGLGYFSQ